jgi:hypothetical protein
MSYYIYQITGAGMTYYGSSQQALCERKASHISTHRYYKKTGNLNKCCTSYKIFDATDDWIMEIIEDGIETEYEALYTENQYINNNECVNINNALGLVGEELKEYKTKWNRHYRLRNGITPLIPIPNQSEEVIKEKRKAIWKKYHETHKEELNQKCKDWHTNNKKDFTEADRQAECDRVKAYCLANPEKVKASKKAQYNAKKDDPEFIAKQKEYYQANKEDKLANQKAHYDANKEVINEHRKAKYEANKDEINAKRKAKYQAKKLGEKL